MVFDELLEVLAGLTGDEVLFLVERVDEEQNAGTYHDDSQEDGGNHEEAFDDGAVERRHQAGACRLL